MSVEASGMEFEWNEDKRQANIAKHGIDFIRCDEVFGNAHLIEPARTVADEQRWMAIGTITEGFVTAIFTRRGETIRIISVRRARHGERRRYSAVFLG